MSKYDYNIVVIGAGSGGLVSAYIASFLKAKVALVEKNKMGGDCLNTGCVPSKAIISSTKIISLKKRHKDFGLKKIDIEFDFKDIMARVHSIIKKIEPHDSVDRYTKLGVECFENAAKIISPNEVELDNGKILTTRSIIIATGAQPFVPAIKGLDKIDYLTSDNVWELKEQPKKLIVLGGGPIGSELSQVFARLGTKVTQIEKNHLILNREDKECSEAIANKLEADGVKILTRHQAKEIIVKDGKNFLICEHNNKNVNVEFDKILIALGRQASVSGFGLEKLGIKLTERKTINTDLFLRTNHKNIFAVGDVAGPYQFTHTAAYQAGFAVQNALFPKLPFMNKKIDYRVIPACTFTDPELARVGLNEKMAKEQKIDYEVTTYGIDDLDRAITDSENYGFVKIITPKGKDKILGVSIVGCHAGDLLAEYVLAMQYKIGLKKILRTIHTYPTLSEANKYAAGNWSKAHIPKMIKFVEKLNNWRR